MKEIGGYFGLDLRHGHFPHEEGVLLNSGNHALQYIVRKFRIHKIHIPDFTCPSVPRSLQNVGCEVSRYEIGPDFMPTRELPANDYILYNNWFGVIGRRVSQMVERHPNLIVDNAQALFSGQNGLASIYSPRKFFGVPDGGIAVFADVLYNQEDESLPESVSFDLMSHVLKRIDIDAFAGYGERGVNSQKLADAPIMRMSKLTRGLLGNVDYEGAKKRRRENFRWLHEHLKSPFSFALADDDVPMVYPYVTDDASLRSRLIEQKIYVAKYWPGLSSAAGVLAERIIPLPIDQRYGESEMNCILEAINER